MSGRHATEKERARQAERLAALKQADDHKPAAREPEEDEESIQQGEPLSAGRAYSPTTLRQAMGIGRSYYNTLISQGMPKKRIGGRIWFSGSRVIEWIESRPDDGDQAS